MRTALHGGAFRTADLGPGFGRGPRTDRRSGGALANQSRALDLAGGASHHSSREFEYPHRSGTGPTQTPPINDTTTYDDVRLPIQAGDALGVDCCNGQMAAFFGSGTSDYWQPPLLDGEPARSATGQISLELLVNADVEPDADHDGYGDETQDQCPTNAAAQGPCPATAAAPTGQRDAALKKCKKKNKKNPNKKKFKKCKKKAKKLPV